MLNDESVRFAPPYAVRLRADWSLYCIRRPDNPAEQGMHVVVLLPSKILLPFCPWRLYLRLTGLIAAGVALLLAPSDVSHRPKHPSSASDNRKFMIIYANAIWGDIESSSLLLSKERPQVLNSQFAIITPTSLSQFTNRYTTL